MIWLHIIIAFLIGFITGGTTIFVLLDLEDSCKEDNHEDRGR